MSNLSQQGKLVKALTAMTSFATVLSMSGVMYLAPTAALAVAPADYGLTEGDVVSAAGSDDPDVYIVNELGYKRLFLNPAIFNFYGHLGGFAAVKNVSASTRDAFGTSGLFRNCETNDPKVYGVEVTAEDTGMLHWVNTSGAQAVMDDANFFKKVFCINNNEFNWYPKGSDYTSVNQVPNYTRGNQTTPPSTGPLAVGLASSNPVGGTIVNGQARYNLADFIFSGSATVTNLQLQRLGVSADATLTNVYLYDGARRLTDSATVSSGIITFNDAGGLFSVSGSKVISVMADISGAAGETVGVRLTSMNGNAVNVSGNLHTVSAVTTPATVVFGASTTPATNTALDPANDVVGWQNTVTVGQRYVWLKSLQLRVIGSVLSGDLRNYRLFVDGVAVGSAVALADANGYIVFDLSGSPVKMETGSRVLKVMLDVVGGSGRNFYLSVRQASDIWAVDSQYASAVLATATAFPVVATNNGVQTITAGTLTVTKTTSSPSGDVVKDGSGVVLARFEFKAAGEKMKVEHLRVSNTSVPPFSLRNGAVFANGVQIGSTATIQEDTVVVATNSLGYTQFNFGSSLIVDPGTPTIVEIRSDIFDASGTNNVVADSTITANIVAETGNVQRLTSLNYTDTIANSGNVLTVKTGSLSNGKYTGYANQSVVVPKNGVKLGHFTLTSASSENVNVNTIDIGFNNVTGFMASKTLDVYIKVWNDTGSLIYTSPVKSTVSAAASSSYSVNFTLPMSKTYQVEVWGNYATPVCIACTHVSEVEMSATGVAASSGTSSTTTPVRAQTITTTTGSLTQANGSVPAAQLRAGGTTATGYQFTLTPAFDDFILEEVYVDLASIIASSTGAVANLILKDGGTTLATATVNATTGSASFTGLNYSLLQSAGTKTLTVDVQFASVGVGANDTGGSVTVRLDGAKYRNSAGTYNTNASTLPLVGLAVTNTGNANVVVKGYPTFTNSALPTTVLNAGSMTLFKTVVSATGGQISWGAITFQVASNSGSIGLTAFKLFENGVDITSVASGSVATGLGAASVSFAGTNDRVEFVFPTERAISSGGSATLELKATVGVAATTNTVSTQITNPKGTTVTTLSRADQELTQPSFLWSDQSSAAHSSATSDWFSDGLVKTLAETQSLTK